MILNSFLIQSVLILGIVLTQVQDLALILIELHDPHRRPPLKIPLDGISSLTCVKCTTTFMKMLINIGPSTYPWSLSH